MVGRTVPVVGRRPTMPYPRYATTFDSLTTYGFDQTQVQRYFFSNHVERVSCSFVHEPTLTFRIKRTHWCEKVERITFYKSYRIM
jgi:hypothetical protein